MVGWWVHLDHSVIGLADIFEIFPGSYESIYTQVEAAVQKDFAKKSIFWGVNFKLKIPYLRNEQDLKYDPPPKIEK